MKFTETHIGVDSGTKLPAESAGAIKGYALPVDIGNAIPANTLAIAQTENLQSALDTLQDNIDAIDPQISGLQDQLDLLPDQFSAITDDITTLDGRIDTHDTDIAALDGRIDDNDTTLAAHALALTAKANLAGGNTFTGTQTIPDINTNFIDFGLVPEPSGHQEGRVFYDTIDKTLVYHTENPDIHMNIGREMWVRAKNTSGAVILNGQVVRISGADSTLPTLALGLADTADNARLLGVCTHEIGIDEIGYVTTLGVVNELNTALYAAGTALYLSSTVAGAFTDVMPAAPHLIVRVAIVQHQHPTEGKLLVDVQLISSLSSGIVDATHLATPDMVVRRSATGGASFNELGIGGDIVVNKTQIVPGVTGDAFIHKNFGSVNFARNMDSLVVVNNRVTPNSIIITSKATNDSAAVLGAAVAGTGQFTLYMDHKPGGEVKVNFMVLN